MKETPSFPSYWLLPGEIAAGPYPGARQSEEASRKLRGLLTQGVRAFVDLTQPGEVTTQGRLAPYGDALAEAAGALGLVAAYVRFPIRDLGVPAPEEMVRILDHLDALRLGGSPTYVHCLGGFGRTGTVLGCYLVRHAGALLGTADARDAGTRALERIVLQREAYAMPFAWDSPQTAAQFALVRSWRVGR